MSGAMRKSAWITAAVGAVLLVGWGGAVWYSRHLGEQRMTRLLNGDRNEQIVKVEIWYQQRQVRCSDPEINDFLTSAIRSQSTRDDAAVGVTYKGAFAFKGGGRFVTTVYRFADGLSLSMPAMAAEEGWPTHNVFLREPTTKVADLLKFLDASWQQAAGTVWIADGNGPPRTEHDEGLVAR